jgi:hypothetical protein
MTAESSSALAAGAEVLVPGTEADGVADAMIEAKMSIEGFLWVWRCRCVRQQLYEPTEALAS